MATHEAPTTTASGLSPHGAAAGRLFDHLGVGYEHAFEGRRQAQIDAVNELTRRLHRGARVLDVGCATGRPTAEQLCANGMDVTGIDVSEVMLEHARRQVPQARFLHADLFLGTPELGTYDAVISFCSLINLPEHDMIDGLRRMKELAVPGGTLLMSVPEHDGETDIAFMGLSYRPDACHCDDLTRWARQAGLEPEKVELRPDPGPPGNKQPGNLIFLWAKAPETP